MKFTGQQLIPGNSSSRIEQDHSERYKFSSQFVKDKDILDIACGTGYGSQTLKEAGAKHIDGVDISEEAINYARANYPDINFIISDAVNYVPDRQYGVIISHVTIEQIRDYKTVLLNFYKWLNPGGLLVISSPNRLITSPNSSMHSFHSQEFTIQEFKKELEIVGFKITGVYGQRSQRYFKNRYLMRIYKKLVKPDKTSSAEVGEIRSGLEPRYFVIKANK